MKLLSHILIISAVMTSGCSRHMDPGDYVTYIRNLDNGLKKETIGGDIKWTLQWRSPEYICLLEKGSEGITKEEIDNRKKELSEFQYFDLRIVSDKCGDILSCNTATQDEYFERNNYYSYGFMNDIHFLTEKDTLPCALYNLSYYYGVAPYMDCLFCFPCTTDNLPSEFVIEINDQMLATESISFRMKKEDLLKLPDLNTN